jgi:hypothetical protein
MKFRTTIAVKIVLHCCAAYAGLRLLTNKPIISKYKNILLNNCDQCFVMSQSKVLLILTMDKEQKSVSLDSSNIS